MQISMKIPVDRSIGPMRQGLLMLASLKLTLVILVVLGIGVVVAYLSETRTIWALVLPLTLCAANLMAAIATNGIFVVSCRCWFFTSACSR
jgi:cytochrome c biogenesis protein